MRARAVKSESENHKREKTFRSLANDEHRFIELLRPVCMTQASPMAALADVSVAFMVAQTIHKPNTNTIFLAGEPG
jgi:hypothetical protein